MRDSWQLALKVAQRQWALYRKNLISNLSPTIVDPILVLLAFGFGVGSHMQAIGSHSYQAFLAPGLVMSAAIFTAFFETTYNFYVNWQYDGLVRAMLTTPLSAREIILGEFIWVAWKGFGMALIMTALFAALGLVHWTLIFVLPFLGVVMSLVFGAIGLYFTSLVRDINQFQSVYSFLIGPMYFFSGAFYAVDDLPPVLRWLSHISPAFHGVRTAQIITLGQPTENLYLMHLPALFGMLALLLVLSYRSLHRKLYF